MKSLPSQRLPGAGTLTLDLTLQEKLIRLRSGKAPSERVGYATSQEARVTLANFKTLNTPSKLPASHRGGNLETHHFSLERPFDSEGL